MVRTLRATDVHHARGLVLTAEHRYPAALRAKGPSLGTSMEGTHVTNNVHHTLLLVFVAVIGPRTTSPPEAGVGGTAGSLAKTHIQRLETTLGPANVRLRRN